MQKFKLQRAFWHNKRLPNVELREVTTRQNSHCYRLPMSSTKVTLPCSLLSEIRKIGKYNESYVRLRRYLLEMHRKYWLCFFMDPKMARKSAQPIGHEM